MIHIVASPDECSYFFERLHQRGGRQAAFTGSHPNRLGISHASSANGAAILRHGRHGSEEHHASRRR